MTFVSPMLAEIADKEPSAWLVCSCGVVSVMISWALVAWKKWLAIVAIPFAAFMAALLLEEVRSPDVGPAIIEELGYSYVVIAYVSALLPFFVIAALLLRRKKENSFRFEARQK